MVEEISLLLLSAEERFAIEHQPSMGVVISRQFVVDIRIILNTFMGDLYQEGN